MLRKFYWYKVHSRGEVIGSAVVPIWFWQSAITAHRDASNHIRWTLGHEDFFICEMIRIK